MSKYSCFLMDVALPFIRIIQSSDDALQFNFQEQIGFKVRVKGV